MNDDELLAVIWILLVTAYTIVVAPLAAQAGAMHYFNLDTSWIECFLVSVAVTSILGVGWGGFGGRPLGQVAGLLTMRAFIITVAYLYWS
jgi:hypothetical protein